MDSSVNGSTVHSVDSSSLGVKPLFRVSSKFTFPRSTGIQEIEIEIQPVLLRSASSISTSSIYLSSHSSASILKVETGSTQTVCIASNLNFLQTQLFSVAQLRVTSNPAT